MVKTLLHSARQCMCANTYLEETQEERSPEYVISLCGVLFAQTRLEILKRSPIGVECDGLACFTPHLYVDEAVTAGIQRTDCNGSIMEKGRGADQIQDTTGLGLIALARLEKSNVNLKARCELILLHEEKEVIYIASCRVLQDSSVQRSRSWCRGRGR